MICSWKITVSQGKTAHLSFVNFNLEDSVNCEISSLQLFDGPNEKSSSFGSKICGQDRPDNIESTGSNLFLLFTKSSSNIRENQFQIKIDEKGN